MNKLIFATTNAGKFATAKAVFDKYGIKVTQKLLEIDEIQGEDPEPIALDKATRAFEAVKQPVLITDDSWSFAGLGGFPGAYMHSMNEWLSPEDFLRLTQPLTDRHVTMTQFLVYMDSKQQKVFSGSYSGRLIKEVRGTSPHPSHTIIAMDGEGGKTIAEVHNSGVKRDERAVAQVWHEFAAWFVTL